MILLGNLVLGSPRRSKAVYAPRASRGSLLPGSATPMRRPLRGAAGDGVGGPPEAGSQASCDELQGFIKNYYELQ